MRASHIFAVCMRASRASSNQARGRSIARAPDLSWRVKHACRLRKYGSRASLRTTSQKSRHKAMAGTLMSGFSILLNHPIANVSQRRGIRLVSRKLMSSCCTTRLIAARTVMAMSLPCNSFQGMNSYVLALAATPLALWMLYRARLRWALSAAKHRSLAGHDRWSRRIARLLPFYEYVDERFFAADAAPQAVVARRHAGFMQLAEVFTARFARSAALT